MTTGLRISNEEWCCYELFFYYITTLNYNIVVFKFINNFDYQGEEYSLIAAKAMAPIVIMIVWRVSV